MKDHDSCMIHVRVWMYISWFFGVAIFLPLQVLITSIFKAYRDEIKEDGTPARESSDYQEIPNEEA